MAERVNSADLGFEKEIFKAADKLRGNIDAAEYKNIKLQDGYLNLYKKNGKSLNDEDIENEE